jgi:hypothetical protein
VDKENNNLNSYKIYHKKNKISLHHNIKKKRNRKHNKILIYKGQLRKAKDKFLEVRMKILRHKKILRTINLKNKD